MVRLSKILRNYPNNSKGSAFYKSLYNFLISLMTHCKNIILSSVEHLKNLKYLSFSCKIEDL